MLAMIRHYEFTKEEKKKEKERAAEDGGTIRTDCQKEIRCGKG